MVKREISRKRNTFRKRNLKRKNTKMMKGGEPSMIGFKRSARKKMLRNAIEFPTTISIVTKLDKYKFEHIVASPPNEKSEYKTVYSISYSTIAQPTNPLFETNWSLENIKDPKHAYKDFIKEAVTDIIEDEDNFRIFRSEKSGLKRIVSKMIDMKIKARKEREANTNSPEDSGSSSD